MKYIAAVALLIFVSLAGWQVGGSLSSDSTSMAVGILLGVMFMIPVTLIVTAGKIERNYHYHAAEQKPEDAGGVRWVVTGEGQAARKQLEMKG